MNLETNPTAIQNRIEFLLNENESSFKTGGASSFTGNHLTKNHAEILALTSRLSDLASEKMDKKTNQLIRLTWSLVLVSIALMVFALIQTAIMLKQNTGAHPQQIQAGQNQ